MIRVGQKLKEERLSRGISVDEISEATKIRSEFLLAIEAGRYDKLPSPAYAHGFVRNYAKYLNMPEEETLAIFRREFDLNKEYDVLPKGLSKSKEFSVKRMRPNRGFMLAGLALSVLLLFIVYQYRFAFINPNLVVEKPQKNQVINSLNIIVSGKTNPDVTLLIMDEPVTLEKDGSFEKSLTFFPGKTTISIKAVNRFGRETVKEIPVEVKPGS